MSTMVKDSLSCQPRKHFRLSSGLEQAQGERRLDAAAALGQADAAHLRALKQVQAARALVPPQGPRTKYQ